MRVGLIGSGYWATTVHGASVARHARADLVGVWGRNPARVAEAASTLGTRPYADVAALLADVDALTFAVPPDVQTEIALTALKARKHVLLEKPLSLTVMDAHALEAAADQSGAASIVFFTRRFVPDAVAWLEQCTALGGWDCGRAEFSSAIFVEGNPFGASPWRHDKGALWDIGPHALSILWPVLGPVTSVMAAGGRGDQVHLVFQHAEGRSSTASLSLTVPPAASGTSLYFYGEHGRETAPMGSADPVAAHMVALDALISQSQQPTPAHACDVHFGARVVEVLAAAEQSLRDGRRVDISRHG